MEAALTLTDLTTGYVQKHSQIVVSKGLNATLNTGQLTCLLGPNGAGKSTLLRTLCGFQPALSGDISIGSASITQMSPQQLSTRIGVVLTERVDVREMSVEELVGLGRSPYTGFWGRLTAADKTAVADAISRVGIDDLAQRQIHTLSDGERQKVMIAKALAQDTPIILLDEPTAFLDFPSKVEMMLLLRRLAHEMNRAVFLSTHDLDMALQTADTLWLLDKQQGLTIGAPSHLSAQLARYFQSPSLIYDPASMRFNIRQEG